MGAGPKHALSLILLHLAVEILSMFLRELAISTFLIEVILDTRDYILDIL